MVPIFYTLWEQEDKDPKGGGLMLQRDINGAQILLL